MRPTRPSWAEEGNDWVRLQLGTAIFRPPDFVVRLGQVGVTLRKDAQKVAGKDRTKYVFRGLDAEEFDVEIRVITSGGERHLRDKQEELLAQKSPGGRDYLRVEHPSLRAVKILYAKVIAYHEQLTDGVLVVKMRCAGSETGGSTQKATHVPKAAVTSSFDVPIIDTGRSTGPGADLRRVNRPSSSMRQR